MANCNIIRSNNKVVYTEAPNGQRSILFDALATKLGSKEEALKFWLASKTPKFLNNVTYPKLTQHRVDLLNRLKTATFKANDITLNVDGRKVNVNLNDISFTNVKRIGFNTVSAYVKPAGAKDTAIPKEGFEIVISPKNEEDLVRVNRYLFGLNEEQAIAAATTMDIIIDSMAKTANITKSEMYDKIGFGKSTTEQLKGTNALFQDSNIFKSTAQEGLAKVPEGKRNAAQWVKAISEKGGKGTSQELEWLGLEDFLEEYQTENKVKSVSKDVVQNYLEDNKIEIKEVTKGVYSSNDFAERRLSPIDQVYTEEDFSGGFNATVFRTVKNQDLRSSDYYKYRVDVNPETGEVYATSPILGNFKEYTNKEEAILDIKKEIAARLLPTTVYTRTADESIDPADGSTYVLSREVAEIQFGKVEPTKYHGYVVPKGAKYREVLLTLPNKLKDLESRYQKLVKKENNETITDEEILELEDLDRRRNTGEDTYYGKAETDYISSHWDGTANILAHMRMNERTLPNGERVLFIEEIQSDWAQEGRRDGFRTKAKLQHNQDIFDKIAKLDSLTLQQEFFRARNKPAADARAQALYSKGYGATIEQDGKYTLEHVTNRYGLPLGQIGKYDVYKDSENSYYISDDIDKIPSNRYWTRELAENSLAKFANEVDYSRDRRKAVDLTTLSEADLDLVNKQKEYYKEASVFDTQIRDILDTGNVTRELIGDETRFRATGLVDEGSVADMPYKNTDQWVGLAVRRILQMASEEGFDRVSWTTGQQGIDKYPSLIDIVDKVEVTKTPNKDSYKLKVYYAEDEKERSFDYLTAKDLPSYVGTQIAAKIIAENTHPETPLAEVLREDKQYQKLLEIQAELDKTDYNEKDYQAWTSAVANTQRYVDEKYSAYQSTTRTYEGEGLEVGGEGMLDFYDNIVPKNFSREAQRFDKSIKIDSIDILVADENLPIPYNRIDSTSRGIVDSFEAGEISEEELTEKLSKRGLNVFFDIPSIPTFYDSNVKSSYSTQKSIAISNTARMSLSNSMPLFQGEKGAMVASDSKYIIYALTNPNVTTPLHELTHVYEKYLNQADKATVLKWANKESWDISTSEAFARGFEKYLSEGKAPIPELQAIFDNFKQWLLDIYNGITGSEIDIELNSEMRTVYAKMLGVDTITMYRGIGNNYASGTNEGFLWVSTERDIAEDYAGLDSNNKLQIEEIVAKRPESIFKLPYKLNTHVTSQNITDHIRRAIAKQLKAKQLDEKTWRAISPKLAEYERLAGDTTERYHTKISKKEVAKILSEILSDLGFEAVEIVEGDVVTYGLIKNNTQNDTKSKSRLFSKRGAKNADRSDFIGKGTTSSQGTRLVEADQVVVGQEAFYNGKSYEVIATTGINSTIKRDGNSIEVNNSKLLVEAVVAKEEVTPLDPQAKDSDAVNDTALNDAVFNQFRANNLEPSDVEVLGTSAYVKYLMDGKITVTKAINKAIAKFQKLGVSPVNNMVNKSAKGSSITTPNVTYNEAVRNNSNEIGDNLWVRNESSEGNEDRVVMVQFASTFLYGKDSFDRSLNSQYFDALYRLIPGYNRTSDFWEIPLWMASMAGIEANSDVYVIRNLEEAQKFLEEAKYKRVLFSALDVNEKHIEQLATNLPNQTFSVGGYTAFENLSKLPNADLFDSVEAYTKKYAVRDKGVYSYRHFKGTQTIPRLKMSEGCTYKCAFCSIPKTVIAMPEADINKMVESMQDLDATLVYLDDKTFGQAKNFRALPAIYEKLKEYNPGFEGFIIQTTSVDFADQKKFGAEFLKASGIKYVELGIETYNDGVLTQLNKKHSHKKFTDAAMQNIRENGLKAIPNIVVGLSWVEGGIVKTEDASTYKNTYDFLEANKDIISHLNVYSLAIYEGTPLGDAIEVRDEADKNENITTKSWQTNQAEHLKAMDMFSKFALDQVEANSRKTAEAAPVEVAPIKLGRLRYKETDTTITVDSSLLSPLVRQEEGQPATSIKNLGIGNKMYSELFKLAIQKGKKLVSSDNLSPSSTKLWDSLVKKGVAIKVGETYEMKMFPKDFDVNGEPSVNNVLNFVDKQSSEGALNDAEIVYLKELMIGLPVGSSSELYNSLKKGFFVDGKFGPTRESLQASKLYTEDDIVDILSDGDLQAEVKDFIFKLEKLEVSVLNDIYTEEAFLVLEDGSKNVIGKLKLANPYTFEKVVISKLGNSKTRQEFEDALYEDEDLESIVDAYEKSKNTYEDLYYKITDFKSVAVATFKDGTLQAKQSETEEILENSLKEVENDGLETNIDFLLAVTPTVWAETPESIGKILKEISKQLAGIGVDATNLVEVARGKEVSEVKDFLTAVKAAIILDNREVFNNLIVSYDKFFNISNDYKFKNVKLRNRITEKNVFYIDSEVPNIELFKKAGLVAVGNNIYKRVSTTKTVEELYDFIYSKLQAEGYSTILPSEALMPAAFDEDNTMNISKITNLNNRENIIDSIRNYVQTKAKEVFIGDSKLTQDELERYVIYTNFYNRTSNVSKFEVYSNMQSEYTIFKGEIKNALYLKTDFPADFYAAKLKAKLDNTQEYTDFYSNFSINSTGIHLDNSDPITLNKMKPYFAKNSDITNYFNLKKGGFNFGVTEAIEPAETELFLRNYYRNFPIALKPYEGNYQRISENSILAVAKEEFIRLDNGVYEFVEGVDNAGLYAKLENNNTIFKEYDKSMPKPEIDIDVNRIKPTVESPINKTVITNKYSEAEASKINDKFDNCN